MPGLDGMQEFFAKAKAPKPVVLLVENPVQQTAPKASLPSEPTPHATLEDCFGKPNQRGDDGWSDFVTRMMTKSDEMLKEQKAWEPYLEKMQPYQHRSTRRNDLFWDGGNGTNPNIGWKCHLNIAPENVTTVSSILKILDLQHKYLFADVSDGKVFTVYLGSKQIAEAAIPLLHAELKDYLLDPKAPGEIPFAPGIVGRFSGSKERFSTKAAYNGITLLVEDDSKIGNPSEVRLAWRRADQELRTRYGDYYGGLIYSYWPLPTEGSALKATLTSAKKARAFSVRERQSTSTGNRLSEIWSQFDSGIVQYEKAFAGLVLPGELRQFVEKAKGDNGTVTGIDLMGQGRVLRELKIDHGIAVTLFDNRSDTLRARDG